MSNCSVASCKNNRRTTDLHGKDISYHRFPKKEEIRQKWQKAVGLNKTITESHHVCSVHFLEDDFERNLRAELLSLPNKRRLKPTAVPSLYINKFEEGNIEVGTKEVSPFNTYKCAEKTAENPITASKPDITYRAIIQRIDLLERLNNELLTSQKVILLNSKRGPCLNLEKDSEDEQPLLDMGSINSTALVPATNVINHINNIERSAENKGHILEESNYITNPDISQDMDEPKSYSKDEGNIRCRTCLENIQMGYFLTDVHVTKTIREMIIFCVPQMASNLSDEDVICSKCLDAIQFCVKFIENCLEVEEKMQTLNRKESTGEYNGQEICNPPTAIDYVKIEHDYVMKSESQRKGEITQPSILESLPANQHQQTKSNIDKNHTQLNHQQLFKCPNCDRISISQKLLINHIGEHSKIPMDDEVQETLLALHSNKTCEQDEEFLELTDRERFLCARCGRLFKTEKYLSIHLRRVHSLVKRSTVESMKEATTKIRKRYVCKFCKCSFLKEGSYKLHLKKHNERRLEICRLCGLKFRNKQELAGHRRQHGIICSVCFKGFSTREEINEHRGTHPDIFFCKVCSKGFKMKKSLTSHAEVHSAYCFYCSECGKGFKSNSALKYHKIIHDPEKKLRCDKCPSTFQDKTKLSLHHRVVHQKIREYQCVKCDKKFGLKTSLKNHNRLTHLKLKTYQCENCGKRFGRRDYLKIHTDHHCKDAKKEHLINDTKEVGSENLEN